MADNTSISDASTLNEEIRLDAAAGLNDEELLEILDDNHDRMITGIANFEREIQNLSGTLDGPIPEVHPVLGDRAPHAIMKLHLHRMVTLYIISDDVSGEDREYSKQNLSILAPPMHWILPDSFPPEQNVLYLIENYDHEFAIRNARNDAVQVTHIAKYKAYLQRLATKMIYTMNDYAPLHTLKAQLEQAIEIEQQLDALGDEDEDEAEGQSDSEGED